MIDIDEIENMKQWTNDYKVQMFWDLVAEVKRLRKTLACIAFSPDEPEWVMSKLEELEVGSEIWKRWME